jgi:hypothetical protein
MAANLGEFSAGVLVPKSAPLEHRETTLEGEERI